MASSTHKSAQQLANEMRVNAATKGVNDAMKKVAEAQKAVEEAKKKIEQIEREMAALQAKIAGKACPEGGVLAVFALNGGGRARLFDAVSGTERWAVDGQDMHAISGDGRFLASVGASKENWTLFDAATGVEWMAGARHDGTGECICTLKRETRSGIHRKFHEGCPVVAHTSVIRALAFSPSPQKMIASGGDDCAVILWDVRTGQAQHRMEGSSQAVTSVSFSARGTLLASGSASGSIRVWVAATGALLTTILAAHDDSVTSVRFSQSLDSLKLVSRGSDGEIKVWGVETGERLSRFLIMGHEFLEVSTDGVFIASAGWTDKLAVQLFNWEGGYKMHLTGHEAEVTSATFSPDGRTLASVRKAQSPKPKA